MFPYPPLFCFPFTKIWIYCIHWEFWDKSSIWRFFIYSELQNHRHLWGSLCTGSRDVGILNLGICGGLFFCLSQMTKKFNFMLTNVWTFGGDMFEIQRTVSYSRKNAVWERPVFMGSDTRALSCQFSICGEAVAPFLGQFHHFASEGLNKIQDTHFLWEP